MPNVYKVVLEKVKILILVETENLRLQERLKYKGNKMINVFSLRKLILCEIGPF